MNEIKRWSVKPWDIRRADMVGDPEGDYVRYDDHVYTTDWLPISTAPTATPVLVWDEYWLMRIGYLKLNGDWVTDSPCAEDIETRINPTHWKKLSKPPES